MTSDVARRIADQGLVAVIRTDDWRLAVSAAEAVVAGGIGVIEVTCTVPGAELAIAELRRRYRDGILIGAGTATTAARATAAADAGAAFLVSPGSTPAALQALVATGLPFAAGAMTPSEVMLAVEHGAEFVKLFPSDVLGTRGLRALRGPFPDVAFVPTGGVSTASVGEWMAAGATALGTGSLLIPGPTLAMRDFATITANAVEMVAALTAWREAQRSGSLNTGSAVPRAG